jgi:hypothetical protein
MFGLAMRYFLSHPLRAVAAIAAEPLEIWTTPRQYYGAQHERLVPSDLYQAEEGWDRRTRELLASRGHAWRPRDSQYRDRKL